MSKSCRPRNFTLGAAPREELRYRLAIESRIGVLMAVGVRGAGGETHGDARRGRPMLRLQTRGSPELLLDPLQTGGISGIGELVIICCPIERTSG